MFRRPSLNTMKISQCVLMQSMLTIDMMISYGANMVAVGTGASIKHEHEKGPIDVRNVKCFF